MDPRAIERQGRPWRVADPDAIAAVHAALEPAELLIADGHHRYETARVYAEEIGGERPAAIVGDGVRAARSAVPPLVRGDHVVAGSGEGTSTPWRLPSSCRTS